MSRDFLSVPRQTQVVTQPLGRLVHGFRQFDRALVAEVEAVIGVVHLGQEHGRPERLLQRPVLMLHRLQDGSGYVPLVPAVQFVQDDANGVPDLVSIHVLSPFGVSPREASRESTWDQRLIRPPVWLPPVRLPALGLTGVLFALETPDPLTARL